MKLIRVTGFPGKNQISIRKEFGLKTFIYYVNTHYTMVDSSENDKFHLFLILKILRRVARWFEKVINNAYIIL